MRVVGGVGDSPLGSRRCWLSCAVMRLSLWILWRYVCILVLDDTELTIHCSAARIPFTSDLNRLLRNFCYHVLVKGSISREVWERHAMTIYNAYMHLLNHLNGLPHKYGVIRTFLHTPEFSEENVEVVIKSFLMSGAWLNFVLGETANQQAARKVVKCVKEAVEEVDACRRPGRFYSGE